MTFQYTAIATAPPFILESKAALLLALSQLGGGGCQLVGEVVKFL